ncbi:hypothetical protein DASB73_023370 [Starmerella bacillaris]|uniref:Uncharacterized protein n=1 Tax=Starmerella bacillaris TaxID=1247836 RepID=A0AAV5RLG2_STABA|nr:hypothetical protein DASB73_023370 [Starmerella bacillaris]
MFKSKAFNFRVKHKKSGFEVQTEPFSDDTKLVSTQPKAVGPPRRASTTISGPFDVRTSRRVMDPVNVKVERDGSLDELETMNRNIQILNEALDTMPTLTDLEIGMRDWGHSWRSKLGRLDFENAKTAVLSASPPSLSLEESYLSTEADSDDLEQVFDFEDEIISSDDDLSSSPPGKSTRKSTASVKFDFNTYKFVEPDQERSDPSQLAMLLPPKSPLHGSYYKEYYG